MRKVAASVFAVAVAVCSTSAHAETLLLKKYRQAHAAGPLPDSILNYISGIADGLETSNIVLSWKKKPMLFCQPESLALNSQNFITIIDTEIKRRIASGEKPYGDEYPVMLILVDGMQRTFPCEK